MKKINYFFINLIYPKPTKIIKSKKDQTSFIKFDNFIYKVYIINKARIYTDTIHTLGVIDQQNRLIDGPSYQIVDNNFLSIKNNKTLSIGTPRKKVTINKSIMLLLSGGGANNNYFHWLFDVLPRLAIMEKLISLKKIDLFLFPDIAQRYQIESLKILRLYNKSLSSKKFRHIEAKKILSTTHPYIFSRKSKKDVENIPKWISLWLKKKFLNVSFNKYHIKRIYIDRRSKTGRVIVNNEEIKNFLIKKYNFKPLYLEDYSFKDQIFIFNQAKFIVGLHGAGFANIAFCKKKTKILELKTKNIGKQIRNIAAQNKLIYSSIDGVLKNKSRNQQGIIEIPLNILKKKLKTLNLAG